MEIVEVMVKCPTVAVCTPLIRLVHLRVMANYLLGPPSSSLGTPSLRAEARALPLGDGVNLTDRQRMILCFLPPLDRHSKSISISNFLSSTDNFWRLSSLCCPTLTGRIESDFTKPLFNVALQVSIPFPCCNF